MDDNNDTPSIFDLLRDIDEVAKRDGRPSPIDDMNKDNYRYDDPLMSPEAEQAAMDAMDRLFAQLEKETLEPPKPDPVMVIIVHLDKDSGMNPMQQLLQMLMQWKPQSPAMEKYNEAFDQQKRMRHAKDAIKQREYPLKLVSLNESVSKNKPDLSAIDYLREVK